MTPCLSMGVSSCNSISKLDNNYATLHSQCGYGNCRWIFSINGDQHHITLSLSLIHAHTHTKHWSNHHKLPSSLLLFNPSHHYPPSDIHSPLFNLTGWVSADWARIIPMWFMSFFFSFFLFFFFPPVLSLLKHSFWFHPTTGFWRYHFSWLEKAPVELSGSLLKVWAGFQEGPCWHIHKYDTLFCPSGVFLVGDGLWIGNR